MQPAKVSCQEPVDLLVIDNRDSFVFNLVHRFHELNPQLHIQVLRSDECALAQALAYDPAGVVISPGPSRPEDAGICLEAVRAFSCPILGVCLGHQVIGQAFGARVAPTELAAHGKGSWVRHTRTSIFQGLPSPAFFARYHSLAVFDLPDCLEALAWLEEDDGLTMALQHQSLPIIGVQFHPESVLSDAGYQLLSNFLDMCSLQTSPHP